MTDIATFNSLADTALAAIAVGWSPGAEAAFVAAQNAREGIAEGLWRDKWRSLSISSGEAMRVKATMDVGAAKSAALAKITAGEDASIELAAFAGAEELARVNAGVRAEPDRAEIVGALVEAARLKGEAAALAAAPTA